jgi:hypothetical protein
MPGGARSRSNSRARAAAGKRKIKAAKTNPAVQFQLVELVSSGWAYQQCPSKPPFQIPL